MHDFPLNAFLISLAADGIALTARDYDRLYLTFQTGGTWTISRLKHVLTVLLAKDRDQQRIISRKFDRFFEQDTESGSQWTEFDIRQVLDELRSLEATPHPTPEPLPPNDDSDDVEPPPPDIPPEPGQTNLQSLLAGSAIVVILAFIIVGVLLGREASIPVISKPELKLSHQTRHFGTLPINTSVQKKITLTSTGTAPLTVENLVLKGQSRHAFEISLPALPKTLSVNQDLSVLISFTPKFSQHYDAVLEITHNAENRVDTVSLIGAAKGSSRPGPKRLYRDVPYVKDITYQPLKRSTAWRSYAALSAAIFTMTLLYALYRAQNLVGGGLA